MTPKLLPQRLHHIWQDALDFITDLLTQFDRAHIRDGIRRTTGAQLSLWLNAAESALRRLILTAALAFTPAPLKPHTTRAATGTTKHTHSFTVFRLHGAGTPTHRRPTHTRQPQPYGHIPFPADPMLALGRVPSRRPTHRHNGGPILPREIRRNPLDRWVRLSRNDPDWRPPPEQGWNPLAYRVIPPPRDEDEYNDEDHQPRPKPKRLDSTADWRRCYDAWEKQIPAPNLAARLDALARAIANPDALIRRTSRRLQSQRERTIALAQTAHPALDLPRRAQRLVLDDTPSDTALAAHRAIDSS
jgi:hypothetical protein